MSKATRLDRIKRPAGSSEMVYSGFGATYGDGATPEVIIVCRTIAELERYVGRIMPVGEFNPALCQEVIVCKKPAEVQPLEQKP